MRTQGIVCGRRRVVYSASDEEADEPAVMAKSHVNMTQGAFQTSIHFFVMLQSPDFYLKRGRFLFPQPLLAINHTHTCSVYPHRKPGPVLRVYLLL